LGELPRFLFLFLARRLDTVGAGFDSLAVG